MNADMVLLKVKNRFLISIFELENLLNFQPLTIFFFFLPLKLLNLTITPYNYSRNPNLNGKPMRDISHWPPI